MIPGESYEEYQQRKQIAADLLKDHGQDDLASELLTSRVIADGVYVTLCHHGAEIRGILHVIRYRNSYLMTRGESREIDLTLTNCTPIPVKSYSFDPRRCANDNNEDGNCNQCIHRGGCVKNGGPFRVPTRIDQSKPKH